MKSAVKGEVTYKDFSRLATELGWTQEMLVERFREKIDRPAEYFERVLSCRWKNPDTGKYEDRSSVVIPYRSVLQFYISELKAWQERTGSENPISEAHKQQLAAARACRKPL